jgi:CRISPR/Cas system CSM-associated protein Csm2 small subunit
MLAQTYIALLTAFGGIILGFVMGHLADYLRATREDKRVLKQVLFNQLYLWVEMKRADVETLVPILVEKFQQALLKRGAQQDQVNAMFNISLTPLIGLLKEMKLAAPERMKERYQESVNQLARVDPLLAYQLSGRPQTDFDETVDAFIEKATEIEGEKAKMPSTTNAVAYFSSFIKGYGQRRTLSNMETDIIDVARKISYLCAFRTRKAIRMLTVRLAEEAEKYIDQFLDSLVMHVATQGPIDPSPVESTSSEPTSQQGHVDSGAKAT